VEGNGFLVQWPTIPTLLMFPVLILVYHRLAIAEEHEVRERFGDTWDAYAAATPRFVPRRRHHGHGAAHAVVGGPRHGDRGIR
jgi:protein-S-isoprenylcysteine O-methyltransferase Ste14